MELTTDEAAQQNQPPNRFLKLTFHDNIAVIQMSYGENRFTVDLIKELNQALDQVENNPNIVALITTGADRFYSNGIDLQLMGYLMQKDPEKVNTYRKYIVKDTLVRILTFPMLTIAALNGHWFAGGGFLGLCHDYRIMQTQKGWLCLNEVHVNLIFDPVTLKIAERKIPTGQTFHDVVVLGKRFTAEEALKHGLVSEISEPKDLLPACISAAKKLLKGGAYNRETLRTMKKTVYNDIINLNKTIVDMSPSKL